MADESDVENVLAGICTGALYPTGTSVPSTAGGVKVSIFRGWPTEQQQELAKAQSFVNVSIAARNGVERNTARYPLVWQTLVGPTHTLTAVVSNNQVTIGGTVAVPQNVFILIGTVATAFAYAVQSSDTLNTIAAALATLINAKYPGTTSTGPVITMATSATLQARVASSGTVVQEVGRQEKSFQVSIWAPPAPSGDADGLRIAVAKVIDPALRQLIRIVMPDMFYAHIKYERTITMDAAEMQGLYRRDLYYWVEYATTISETAYEIGDFQVQLSSVPQPTDQPLPPGTPVVTTNF